VSFIDDYSKFVWVYLLRHKSEVFQRFKGFQNLVERQFGKKIQTMQTDWGGEYQALNSFFKRVGINHHVSCPHAHQQNGSAERKHRHIVEVGLTLLSHSSMPLKFWDEAFSTVVFLINRLPSKVINDETPFERLFGMQPDYNFLRTFRCAVWPNLRPYNSRKLEYRSKQCVFIGYSDMHKGFKCLDPKEGRVYISRDVVFDESVFPFASLHPNAGARLKSEIALLPDILKNSLSSFWDANLQDQHELSPAYTNVSSSAADVLDEIGTNSEENGLQHAPGGRYLMCPPDADIIRSEGDLPGASVPPAGGYTPGSASRRAPGAKADASTDSPGSSIGGSGSATMATSSITP